MAAAPAGGETVSREQLEALRGKFERVRRDRRAFFDAYEATKRANDERIMELRAKHKQLQQNVRAAQKNAGSSKRAAAGGGSVAKLSNDLVKHRQRYDQLRHEAKRLQTDFERERTSLEVLQRQEAEQLKDTPATRRIRQLEARLDAAMIKFNEAKGIGTTYQQILARLNDERVSFDTQLKAVEQNLKAKKQDHTELQQLAREARHAKEIALAELDRVKAVAAEGKQERMKQMRELRATAMARAAAEGADREREDARRDLRKEIEGDMGYQEEVRLAQALQEARDQHEQLQGREASLREKVRMYEEAFRHIREATGVKDEHEVIQKVLDQREQHEGLKHLTGDHAARLEELQEEQAELKEQIDAIKFSGAAAVDGRGATGRRAVDTLDTELKGATKELGVARERYERAARALVELQAGAEHLQRRLYGAEQLQAAAAGRSAPPAQPGQGPAQPVSKMLRRCRRVLIWTRAELARFAERMSGQAVADGLVRAEALDERPDLVRSVLPAAVATAVYGSG